MIALALILAKIQVATTAPPAGNGGQAIVAIVGGGSSLPDRGDDARVASVAFRIASAGRARCADPAAATGLVFQLPAQFHPADRAAVTAAYALDRGPGVIVVASGSPAAAAGVRAGDTLLAIDGTPVMVDADAQAPFDAERARLEVDAIHAGFERSAPVTLTLLRDGRSLSARLSPVPGCPSRVHLARSEQRNAYADGGHVFITTGLLRRMRNDDELAFVIAHEMAHNVLRHAETMRRAGVKRGLGRSFGKSGRVVRGAEAEADQLAGALMLEAGFDPVAGAAVLKRLGGRELGIGLFDVHASPDKRVEAMRMLAAARRGG